MLPLEGVCDEAGGADPLPLRSNVALDREAHPVAGEIVRIARLAPEWVRRSQSRWLPPPARVLGPRVGEAVDDVEVARASRRAARREKVSILTGCQARGAGIRSVMTVARGSISRASTVTSAPCRASSCATCQATFSTPPPAGRNRSITSAIRRMASSAEGAKVSSRRDAGEPAGRAGASGAVHRA